jgi:hypothetical protein
MLRNANLYRPQHPSSYLCFLVYTVVTKHFVNSIS